MEIIKSEIQLQAEKTKSHCHSEIRLVKDSDRKKSVKTRKEKDVTYREINVRTNMGFSPNYLSQNPMDHRSDRYA